MMTVLRRFSIWMTMVGERLLLKQVHMSSYVYVACIDTMPMSLWHV